MPRQILTADGLVYRVAEYALPPLADHEVAVQVTLAAPKHGTELHSLRGSAFDRRQWDADLRLFLPGETEAPPTAPRERGIGNMFVGTVSQVGAAVTAWQVGDRVYGYGGVREVHHVPADRLTALGALSEVDAVCTDPAHVAFVAVRDGKVRIGDTVAVFGLGAIGQMAVQLAAAGGALQVFAVDPLALRREVAGAHGAVALDPTATDVALAIKQATGGKGVDVAIETSGNGRALHEAIRCIRQCGTVVHVPWGPHDCTALHLDEEFHLNRPTLVGSQCWEGWGNPDRDHPLWDGPRQHAAVATLFASGRLSGTGVVAPLVPFDAAVEALATIATQPERSVKLGVSFAP